MLRAALADGTANRQCVFEVFTRRLPSWRRYGVFAGAGRLIDLLSGFRFTDDDLRFLSQQNIIDEATRAFLANYQFRGTITGLAEGETYFPGTPLLTVRGTFAEAVILETLALSVLNFDSAIAAAASRMTSAAGDRPCLDMGARRTHEQSAVAAARAAFIAGFAGTSNLAAGANYGISTIGTAAHAFTLLHDSEDEAFTSQVNMFGAGTTLLVDTYDVPTAIERAVEIAGPDLGAVRLDSGDLALMARQVRDQLDALGAHRTKIVVTSDLDEYAIAALAAAPVDSYGVGTRLVTGSGAPTCSMVYKLVAREGSDGLMEAVEKASTAKTSVGGLKRVARQYDGDHVAISDLVVGGDHTSVTAWKPADNQRQLHVDYVVDGKPVAERLGTAALHAAQLHHEKSRAELPATALRLSSGEPALPVIFTALP